MILRTRPKRRARVPQGGKQIGQPGLVGDDVLALMPASGAIYDYVCWAVQETFADPLYHLAAILPVAAYEACTLGWGGPWPAPRRGRQGALQTFLIGPPGGGKSSAMRMAKSFHVDTMRRTQGALWLDEHEPWIMAEGTIPGMLEVLHAKYEEDLDITPAIFYHEEVSSLLEKGGVVIDTMMQLFEKIPSFKRQLRQYQQMRADGETPPDTILRPAVGGVFCGTTSSASRTLTPAHFEGGLVSRSLWFTGEAVTSRFWDSDNDDEGRADCIERWTQLGRRLQGATLDQRSLQPISAECKELISPMYARYQKASAEGAGDVAAMLTRGMNMAMQIASLYGLSRGQLGASADDMRAALALVETSHAMVETLKGATAEDAIYRLSERAMDLIKRAGTKGLTRTKLNRNGLRVNSGTLDQVVELLKESGLVLVETKKDNGVGRPSQRFFWQKAIKREGNVIHLPFRTDEAPET